MYMYFVNWTTQTNHFGFFIYRVDKFRFCQNHILRYHVKLINLTVFSWNRKNERGCEMMVKRSGSISPKHWHRNNLSNANIFSSITSTYKFNNNIYIIYIAHLWFNNLCLSLERLKNLFILEETKMLTGEKIQNWILLSQKRLHESHDITVVLSRQLKPLI